MTRFRELDRKAQLDRSSGYRPGSTPEVFLIEESVAMGLLLQGRIKAKTTAEVSWFRSYAAAAAALEERRPALAITGTSLPDAPAGEILDLLAAALPNSAIATRLNLSPKTVANHLSSIFTKIQVADRSAAILRAREAGLGPRAAAP